jgi:predicted regulator of Ras-like GTPase activity (Roadblock/LC7/MglB family)
MSFRAHLQAVCQGVDGAIACTLMGLDGLEVASWSADAPAASGLAPLLVEYSSALRQLRESARAQDAGELTEVTLSTDRLVTVARLVSPDYFMAVALRPDGNQGKARFLLRIAAPKVKAEL